MKMTGKLYAVRNPQELDRLGNYYSRHVIAMTEEDLYSKSDIAAELAHRDLEIDRLKALMKGLDLMSSIARKAVEDIDSLVKEQQDLYTEIQELSVELNKCHLEIDKHQRN